MIQILHKLSKCTCLKKLKLNIKRISNTPAIDTPFLENIGQMENLEVLILDFENLRIIDTFKDIDKLKFGKNLRKFGF